MRLCILLCFLSLLAGCAEKIPKTFGIPLSEWNNASDSQRENLIGQYGVNDLSHYDTEPKVTMDSPNQHPVVTPAQSLSILDERKTPAITEPPKPITPIKIETLVPPKQVPDENNWLQLNN